MLTLVPNSLDELINNLPPQDFAIISAIDSPNPVPVVFVLKNACDTFGKFSSLIPAPLSDTVKSMF
jgi:hypothetical protein